MSDLLQRAIFAIQDGRERYGQNLLKQLLEQEPDNDMAWVWLARITSSPEWRQACLRQALALNPDNLEAKRTLLASIIESQSDSIEIETGPPTTLTTDISTATSGTMTRGKSLKEFYQDLKENFRLLKEREAKYATAAPLDLLNQLDDYEEAITLTEEALETDVSFAEIQGEFKHLNLEMSGVVFITQDEPPRKPFTGVNPYQGLQKFTEQEAEFFFGRNAAIENLLDKIDYLVEADTNKEEPDFIAVLGPSGSGKSSLVRAGLLPALREGKAKNSSEWLIQVMLPGANPLEALAEIFLGEVNRDLSSIRESLAKENLALHDLMVEVLTVTEQSSKSVFVLVVDQFEEIFTMCESEAERVTFIELLLNAAQVRHNRSFIIITMRSDFYSKVAAYNPLAEAITHQQMLVSPMTEKELREAILLPAEAVGLELEKGLIEDLLNDTINAPGVLPLLQYALLELFERRDGNLLTSAAYEEIGGVQGALAHRADTILDQMTMNQRHLVRRILMRLVQPGDGTDDTRRRATFSEVLPSGSSVEEVETIVEKLAKANLIVTSFHPETNEVVIDVSHETLIREWPRFQSWLDWDRQGLRVRQQLSHSVREWLDRERETDSLYRGARLLEVEEWTEANPGEINQAEEEFIQASIEVRDRIAREKEAQRQRELDHQRALAEEQRRRAETQIKAARRLRRFIEGLVILLIIAVAAVFIAFNQSNASTARELAAKGETLLNENNAHLAALLASEANRLSAHAGDSILSQVPYQTIHISATGWMGHTNWVRTVDWHTTGAYLASGSNDKTAIIWDAHSGEVLHQLNEQADKHSDEIRGIAWHPQELRLATGSKDTTIILWDGETGEALKTLEGHSSWVNSVHWDPTGQWLASASTDRTIILWDGESGDRLRTLEGHTKWVTDIDWSPDGKWLISASQDNSLIIWDGETGEQAQTLTGHENWVNSVAWHPQAQKIASGARDRTVIIWDSETGEMLQTLSGHQEEIRSVAWHPEGKWLASASEDQTIIIWDGETGERVYTLNSHSDIVRIVTWHPINQWLTSGSNDTTIILWDIETGRNPQTLNEHQDTIHSIAWSSDGALLASGSEDQSVIIWDPQTDSPLHTLTDHTDWVNSVAWHPQETKLASASNDQTIMLWDGRSGERLGELRGHTDWVDTLAWHNEGRRLASGSGDKTVVIWDSETRTPIHTLTGHTHWVHDVAWHPQGKLLASASEDTNVIIWDGQAGTNLKTLAGHELGVNAVAWHPDGKRLASAAKDQTVMIWDSETGTRLHMLTEHTDWVNSVAWDPEGKWLASSSSDGSIIIWDGETGQNLHTFAGHTDGIDTVTWHPTGQWLTSAGKDKSIKLLPTEFIQSPCDWLIRNFTENEWENYRRSSPYVTTCSTLNRPDLPVLESSHWDPFDLGGVTVPFNMITWRGTILMWSLFIIGVGLIGLGLWYLVLFLHPILWPNEEDTEPIEKLDEVVAEKMNDTLESS